MAAMALRLTFCLLVIVLAQSVENVEKSEFGRLKRRPVKKDDVVFFKAFLSENTAYGARSTLVFSDVQHNMGQAYNPASGIFTAPVTGLYEFKCRLERTAGGSAEFAIFNQFLPRTNVDVTNNYSSYGMSSIMKVKKGDHIYVRITWSSEKNNITLRAAYFTQFSGYLIRQL